MTVLYTSLLLVHVASALGFFAVQGIALLAIHELKSAASADEARRAFARFGVAEKLMAPWPPLLLLSGIILCAVAWGFSQAWVILALLGFVATAVLARGVDAPRLGRARALLERGASFASDVRPMLHGPVAQRSQWSHHGLLVWIVFLMVVKPALVPALIALGIALVPALLVTVRSTSPLRTAREA